MRILFACALFAVLGVTRAAFADAVGCGGCGGDDTSYSPDQDLSAQKDMSAPAHDLSMPDLARPRDARREARPRHRRAAGAGSVVVAALALSGAIFARRRVRS